MPRAPISLFGVIPAQQRFDSADAPSASVRWADRARRIAVLDRRTQVHAQRETPQCFLVHARGERARCGYGLRFLHDTSLCRHRAALRRWRCTRSMGATPILAVIAISLPAIWYGWRSARCTISSTLRRSENSSASRTANSSPAMRETMKRSSMTDCSRVAASCRTSSPARCPSVSLIDLIRRDRDTAPRAVRIAPLRPRARERVRARKPCGSEVP